MAKVVLAFEFFVYFGEKRAHLAMLGVKGAGFFGEFGSFAQAATFAKTLKFGRLQQAIGGLLLLAGLRALMSLAHLIDHRGFHRAAGLVNLLDQPGHFVLGGIVDDARQKAERLVAIAEEVAVNLCHAHAHIVMRRGLFLDATFKIIDEQDALKIAALAVDVADRKSVV